MSENLRGDFFWLTLYTTTKDRTQHSCRLSDDITIFAGELAALNMALLWIKDDYERNDLQQDIVIFGLCGYSDGFSRKETLKDSGVAR